VFFKNTLAQLLNYVSPRSLPVSQYCVTLAQQGMKNAAVHLKMMVAAPSGMFRGLNQSPHHLQCTASNLSPGYAYELLTRLSLKKCNLLRAAVQTLTQPHLEHGEIIS